MAVNDASDKPLNNLQQSQDEEGQSLSWRAVLISVVIVIAFTYFLQNIQFYALTGEAERFSRDVPSPAGLFCLLCFLLLNAIFRKLKGQRLFSGSELGTIYILTSIGVFFAGAGYFLWTFAVIMGRSNAVANLNYLRYFAHISEHVVPSNIDVMYDIAFGEVPVNWSVWISPVLLWSLFGTVVFAVMIAMTAIMQKRWVEQERLTFPLVQPVLALINEGEREQGDKSSLVSGRWLLLIGAIYPLIMIGFPIINRFYPAFPVIRDTISLAPLFPEEPWRSMATYPPGLRFIHDPLVVGIAYMMPVNITFTTIFFYCIDLFGRFLLGIYGHHIFPRVGLYPISLFAYGVMMIWVARGYLKNILHQAFSKQTDSDSFLSYRAAVIIFIAGCVFLIVFSRVFLGISVFVAIIYFALALLSILAFAGVRASTGIPVTKALEWQDCNVITSLAGGFNYVGQENVLGMAHFVPLHVPGLSSGSALVSETFKLIEDVRLKRNGFAYVMIGMVFVVLVLSFVFALPVVYENGWYLANERARTMGTAPFDSHIIWRLETGRDFGGGQPFTRAWLIANIWHFTSLIMTPLLTVLHMKFIWWPLHPVGYIIASDVDIAGKFWGSFLIAGTIKFFVMRYGGVGVYRKLQPIFFGMILGTALFSGLDVLISYLMV